MQKICNNVFEIRNAVHPSQKKISLDIGNHAGRPHMGVVDGFAELFISSMGLRG